ncbi:hypothetical protein QW180_28130 [Vibrio sinaloensis]|nr:hypothetical protein [Vibrio sinaloensis]
MSLSTGERIHPVTVSLPAGLHSSTIYASNTAKALNVNLSSIEGVKEGLNTFTATASAQVGEHTINKQFDVNVLASRHALVVPDRGVALTKFATKQRLSAEIDILDSYGFTDTLWTASTEAPWLTVTISGTTADKLQLSADTSGLASNQLHEAEVIVVSDDASIANSNSIRVSLWVGDTDPAEKQVIAKKRQSMSQLTQLDLTSTLTMVPPILLKSAFTIAIRRNILQGYHLARLTSLVTSK